MLLAELIIETYPPKRLVSNCKVKIVTKIILLTTKPFVNDINQVRKVLIVLGALSDKKI